MKDALESLVTSTLTDIGLDLFELRQKGSAARPILDVRIERPDGAEVTVADCATASRALEARLDAQRLLGERYVLEVSSPGIERPLRNAEDWRRYAGRTALVTSDALGGSAEVEIIGVENTPDGDVGIVRTARDVEVRVPLAGVRKARLAFTWKR